MTSNFTRSNERQAHQALLLVLAMALAVSAVGCASLRATQSLDRGQKLLADGQVELALTRLENACQQNPGDWLARNACGWAAIAAGQLDLAATHFLAVIDAPGSGRLLQREAWNGLATVRYQQGAWSEVLPLLDQSLEVWPGWLAGRAMAGWTAFYLEDFSKAQHHFQNLLWRAPNSSEARRGLGLIAYRTGEFAVARKQLNSALRYAPSFYRPQIHIELGWNEFYQDEWDRAAVFFQRALSLDSALAEAHVGVGWCAVRQGKLDEAGAAFRAALTLVPDYPSALAGLASLGEQP